MSFKAASEMKENGKGATPSEAATSPSDNPFSFERLAEEGLESLMPIEGTPIVCGVYGHDGSGKTGIVMDSLTEEQVAFGDQIYWMDFDGGIKVLRYAHHDNRTNDVIWNPVVRDEELGSFDYLKTHQKASRLAAYMQHTVRTERRAYNEWRKDIFDRVEETIDDDNLVGDLWPKCKDDLIRPVKDVEQLCKALDMPMRQPLIVALVLDGADSLLLACENVMKIHDLNLAADAVGAAQSNKEVGRFNWNIRTTRYYDVVFSLIEAADYGVDVYFITHLKKDYQSGTGIQIGWKPWWEDKMENKMHHVISMTKEYNPETETTTLVAQFEKCKSRIELEGRKRTVASINEEGAVWHGLSELKDGSL
jgi:hypothetical protein